MKPITTPINLTPRGILSDRMCVKTAMCMRVSVCVCTPEVQLHLIVLSKPVKKKKKKTELLFFLADDEFHPQIKPLHRGPFGFGANAFQKILRVSFTERCSSV